MTRPMESKVALVTGGGSGIGRATALAFSRQGARVVIADVHSTGGKETLRLIEAGDGQGIFIKTDVTQAVEVANMVESTVKTYGRLDYAHNNAGIEPRSTPIVDVEEKVWDRILSVNLKGVWLCLKYEIPQMLKQGQGAIVNTSSTAGLKAVGDVSPYVASKHGVVGLTKAAAVEYNRAGIRVNAVCPGPTDTPMMDRIMQQGGGDNKPPDIPMGDGLNNRLGTPEEIAEVVLWLCSDAASFVTGCALAVDGGRAL